jgi:hypothetical protein
MKFPSTHARGAHHEGLPHGMAFRGKKKGLGFRVSVLGFLKNPSLPRLLHVKAKKFMVR